MRLIKIIFLGALAIAALLHWQIDVLPEPEFYDSALLLAPEQTPLHSAVFTTQAGDQSYQIKPLFNYLLNGVVVSLHDAGDMRDIWHHENWKDFLNVRDLCVMWGNNVTAGVYKKMDFHNDSWTCWASWYDNETGKQFAGNQLSNNHLLVDDQAIKKALMSVRVGDQIQFSGYLAAYRNPANQFQRGTSITRDDKGNGACETVYLTDFRLIKSANPGKRLIYAIAKWIALAGLVIIIIDFVKSPVSRKYR